MSVQMPWTLRTLQGFAPCWPCWPYENTANTNASAYMSTSSLAEATPKPLSARNSGSGATSRPLGVRNSRSAATLKPPGTRNGCSEATSKPPRAQNHCPSLLRNHTFKIAVQTHRSKSMFRKAGVGFTSLCFCLLCLTSLRACICTGSH